MRRRKSDALPGLLPRICAGICLALVLIGRCQPTAARPPSEVGFESSALHQTWLREVASLITEEEQEAFLALRRDYQRAAFVERFWQVRDPFPETERNEFLELWLQRLELARERFPELDDVRAQTLLLVGPPQQILTDLCPELLGPIEAWQYVRDDVSPDDFYLLFVGRTRGLEASWGRWSAAEGLDSLRELSQRCGRERELLEVIDRTLDWEHLLEQVPLIPPPTGGWVVSFLDRRTDLDPGAQTFTASVQLQFPGRHQNRIVVQGLIHVPRQLVSVGDSGDGMIRLRIDGELLREETLVETFRYDFDLPAAEINADQIPLAIQRFLRPSDYDLILKLQDLSSGRVFRTEQRIHVPAILEPMASTRAPLSSGDGAGRIGSARQLAEANAVLTEGDHLVKILPPPDRLLTDRIRVEARAVGEGIAKVTFVLNGRPVMSKTREPYSVELDLGRAPRLHTLEAVAVDAGGAELARDRVPINAGPHRFAVRLLDPQPGKRYVQSLRAHAEVDVPAGEQLDRLDFYLNETRLATLYQRPFIQPILLPQGERITYVRAVAYLADGNATEDLVFINAPSQMDRLRINMVELYTSVCDKRGAPVEGLERGDFTVYEEDIEQEIARFERVRDLSIHAGIVLDASTSMAEELQEAVKAALKFFQGVLRPKDRAAVVVFNDLPILKVPFTNNLEVLTGGLAELEAEGDTALYDTLVYTLYYFAGLRGKRAVILLSDGHDSGSRHSLEEAMEFASRSGVAIYTIGLGLSQRDMQVRLILQRLARQTGGRSFLISSARQLDSIYAAIEEELRSQYLLAYQSSHEEGGAFRRVEVRVDRPELKAKTVPGYYP